MSDAEFQSRLSRIAQNRAPQAHEAPKPEQRPPSGYHERLHRALTVAAAAGISRDAGFPPLMRGLAAMGLPVRPLHFKSALSLFVSGVLLGLFIFGGALWLVTASGAAPSSGPVAGLVSLGWPGVFAISVAIGVAFAVMIRAQATSKRLPGWHDL